MEMYLNIKGSKDSIYVVSICTDKEDSFFDCDCPASNHSAGQICKHRLALLNWDFSNIIDADAEEIELLKEFILNSNTQDYLDVLESIQSEFDRIKAEEKKLKSLLAQTKRDLLRKFYSSDE